MSLSELQDVAEKAIGGELEWVVEGNRSWAEVDCPGAALHTNPTDKRHTRLYLKGGLPPTIHCQHSSCSGEIKKANFNLRSRIGKATAEVRRSSTANSSERKRRQLLAKRQRRKELERQTGKALRNLPIKTPGSTDLKSTAEAPNKNSVNRPVRLEKFRRWEKKVLSRWDNSGQAVSVEEPEKKEKAKPSLVEEFNWITRKE